MNEFDAQMQKANDDLRKVEQEAAQMVRTALEVWQWQVRNIHKAHGVIPLALQMLADGHRLSVKRFPDGDSYVDVDFKAIYTKEREAVDESIDFCVRAGFIEDTRHDYDSIEFTYEMTPAGRALVEAVRGTK